MLRIVVVNKDLFLLINFIRYETGGGGEGGEVGG